jgi:hypothetical protein
MDTSSGIIDVDEDDDNDDEEAFYDVGDDTTPGWLSFLCCSIP